MARPAQTIDLLRRKPKQARAQDTVEIIFEATARILRQEGRDALNTNYIAESAGISVGTLYQYFPDKQAILVAMARREIAADEACVIKAMSEPTAAGEADLVRRAIRALIAQFRRNREARRIAIETLISEGYGHEQASSIQKVTQMIGAKSDRFLPGRAEPVSDASLFVITRAVSGVIRAASQEQSPLLDSQEFEDELVHLVRAYFRS
ncbi:MAG TPA: TetR/AcrR family transcriptional regulator [Candidatus Angelobacter sp.]